MKMHMILLEHLSNNSSLENMTSKLQPLTTIDQSFLLPPLPQFGVSSAQHDNLMKQRVEIEEEYSSWLSRRPR